MVVTTAKGIAGGFPLGAIWVSDRPVTLKTGDCAGWKANVPNGHCIVNRTNADVLLLEVGTRAQAERSHYPGSDLKFERDGTAIRVLHLNGEPY